jgi:hypothetical protein
MDTFKRLLVGALICVVAKTYAQPPKSIPRRADISVSGIFLEDPASTEKVLGKEIPHGEQLAYWNKDRTELLTLFFHGGDTVHAFAEFKVTRAGESDSAVKALPFASFITGKGVHLGLSQRQIMGIFGKGVEEDAGKQHIIRYTIEDAQTKMPFLKHYAMPSYYGEYRFKGGKLIEFSFGFELP